MIKLFSVEIKERRRFFAYFKDINFAWKKNILCCLFFKWVLNHEPIQEKSEYWRAEAIILINTLPSCSLASQFVSSLSLIPLWDSGLLSLTHFPYCTTGCGTLLTCWRSLTRIEQKDSGQSGHPGHEEKNNKLLRAMTADCKSQKYCLNFSQFWNCLQMFACCCFKKKSIVF